MELDLYAYDAPDGHRWSFTPVQVRAEDPAAKIEGATDPGVGEPRPVARVRVPEGTRVDEADPAVLVVPGTGRVDIAGVMAGRTHPAGITILRN